LRFLLDENFPLRLHRRLKAEGIDCEHLIVLGLRGITDAQLVQRVADQDAVLLTQDREFEYLPIQGGKVIISRVPQSLPMQRRVDFGSGPSSDSSRPSRRGSASRSLRMASSSAFQGKTPPDRLVGSPR